jgi:glycosyltransferase involved in cell wall biosynthesis
MISYPFPPNPSAGAVRSERFARYLAEFGWGIDVITIKPQQAQPVSDSELFGDKIAVHRTRTLDPWLWLLNKIPKNIILRAIRSVLMRIFSFPDHMMLWLPFAVFRCFKICREKEINAIYTTSPPHSSQIIGYLLAKITGIPWVADFRDPWTLNAYKDTGVIDTILFKISAMMERVVYKHATVVLVNTKANRQNLIQHFKFIDSSKIVYLPNGCEAFPESYHKPSRHENDKTLMIVHAGNFYPRFKPYALFYALSLWKKGDVARDIPPLGPGEIRVLLLGATDLTTEMLLKQLEIDDIVEIKKWVEQNEAQREMCQADLLLATLGTGKSSSTYIPSKLFEYFSARKPILGFFPEGVARDLIHETNTGIVFTSDNPVPVAQFLKKMILHKKNDEIPYAPNELNVSGYDIRKNVKRLEAILNIF